MFCYGAGYIAVFFFEVSVFRLTRCGTSRCCFHGPKEMRRCPSARHPNHPPRLCHRLCTRVACTHRNHTPYTCVNSHRPLSTASRARAHPVHACSTHVHATLPRVRVRSVAAHRTSDAAKGDRAPGTHEPSESSSTCCSRALMKDSASSRGPAWLLVCMLPLREERE